MNRNLTLILSVVLVFVLLGIWLYLVFFADRSTDEPIAEESGEFADFDGLGDDAPSPGPNDGSGTGSGAGGEVVESEYGLDILRQLTTKKVAGYAEVEVASSTNVIFMESGVGHIYQIDLSTGQEERVSATTIPEARSAVFSNDGQSFLVKTGGDGYTPLLFGEIDYTEQTVSLTPVADMVGTFTFSETGEALYATVGNASLRVLSKDLDSGTVSTVFTTPFREALVDLNEDAAGPHYFYPKTSYVLEGFVYEVINGNFYRTPLDGFGFAANRVDDELVVSYREQSSLVTEIYDINTEEVVRVDTPLLPSKCVATSDGLHCAIPNNHSLQYNSIDRWLKGTLLFSDSLWLIDEEESQELVNIKNRKGRGVDVMNGVIGPLSDDWYFQNKADGSLWIYELSEVYMDTIEEDAIITDEIP